MASANNQWNSCIFSSLVMCHCYQFIKLCLFLMKMTTRLFLWTGSTRLKIHSTETGDGEQRRKGQNLQRNKSFSLVLDDGRVRQLCDTKVCWVWVWRAPEEDLDGCSPQCWDAQCSNVWLQSYPEVVRHFINGTKENYI